MKMPTEEMLNQISSFDGLPVFLAINGQYYEKTGNMDGWGVYCVFGDFRRWAASFSDKGGFVHRSGELIPLEKYARGEVRQFTPYNPSFKDSSP